MFNTTAKRVISTIRPRLNSSVAFFHSSSVICTNESKINKPIEHPFEYLDIHPYDTLTWAVALKPELLMNLPILTWALTNPMLVAFLQTRNTSNITFDKVSQSIDINYSNSNLK